MDTDFLSNLMSVLRSSVHLSYVLDNEALASEWRIYTRRAEGEADTRPGLDSAARDNKYVRIKE